MVRPTAAARRGIAAPAVAVCLIVLMAVLALSIDAGMLMMERRHAQSAADAAAMAAVTDLYRQQMANSNNGGIDGATGTAKTSAKTTALGNGYAAPAVTVNVNPAKFAEGPKTGQQVPPGTAEVIILGSQKRGFSSVFGLGDLPIHARAVARERDVPLGLGILVLNPTIQGALTVTGSGTITVAAPIIIDSAHTKAAVSSGSASIEAPSIPITGDNPGYTSSGSSGFRSPDLRTGVPPTPDPLASLPPPNPDELPLRSASTYTASENEILYPGVYKGGITISSKPGVTLAAGIYYLMGGGLTMSGGSSSLSGDGVMIYNGADSSGKTGKVTVSGGGAFQMTPLASGPYSGLLIFQDRTSTQPITLSGGSTWNFTGGVYAAKAPVDLTGGSGGTFGSQYICDTLDITGSSSFRMADPGTGYRKRFIGLVE